MNASAMGPADALRPRIHLSPPSGWMNDPHGIAISDGRLHLFYQSEPDAPRWGRMRWGHASTRDLLRWEHAPIALEPEPGGPDSLGCWSGSLVTGPDGLPTIFYTAVSGTLDDRHPAIAMATSNDDHRTWRRSSGGPVIPGPPAGIRRDAFRDPFVWADGTGWAMLVGAGTTTTSGAVLLYRSDDLRTWRHVGPFLSTEAAVAADPALVVDDIDSPCWECPQLVRLDDAAVLLVSIVDRSPFVRPSHVVAFVGRVAGDRFIVERGERLGLGPDFYAPCATTLPDGRALLFGWIPEDPPGPGSPRTWAGAATLPRVISIDDERRPTIALAEEVAALGTGRREPSQRIEVDRPWRRRLAEPHVDWAARLIPDGAASVRIDLRGATRVLAEIRYEPRTRRLTVTRTGRVEVAGRDPHRTTVLPPTTDGSVRLRLIIDGSILEAVVDDRVTATARLPDDDRVEILEISTIGGACDVRDPSVTTF